MIQLSAPYLMFPSLRLKEGRRLWCFVNKTGTLHCVTNWMDYTFLYTYECTPAVHVSCWMNECNTLLGPFFLHSYLWPLLWFNIISLSKFHSTYFSIDHSHLGWVTYSNSEQLGGKKKKFRHLWALPFCLFSSNTLLFLNPLLSLCLSSPNPPCTTESRVAF